MEESSRATTNANDSRRHCQTLLERYLQVSILRNRPYRTTYNRSSKKDQPSLTTGPEALHGRLEFGAPRVHSSGTVPPPRHNGHFHKMPPMLQDGKNADLVPSKNHLRSRCSTTSNELPAQQVDPKRSTNILPSISPHHAPSDDDLEDLACLDAAISREQVRIPVQQSHQAFESTVELAEVPGPTARIVVSRYFRDLDETVYMAHVSNKDSWETVRDDPAFAPIESGSPVIPFWTLGQNLQQMTAESHGFKGFTVGIGAGVDRDEGTSVAMSESEGGSPPPRTQSANNRICAEQDREPPSLDGDGSCFQASGSTSITVSPARPDRVRSQQFLLLDKYFPTFQFVSAKSAALDHCRQQPFYQPSKLLAVDNTATAATHRQAISALQYTTPGQWEVLEVPTVADSPSASPHTKHIIPHKTRPPVNNDNERPKISSKQTNTQSSPNQQTTQSCTPPVSSTIKIKIKLNLPGPEPDSDHKSEAHKNSANHSANIRPETPDKLEDQEENAASTTTDLKRRAQPRPSSYTGASQQEQHHRHRHYLAPPSRRPEHTTDGSAKAESARGRSLRQNPTPSRKRRYSEHEHEPSSSQKPPRAPSHSGQSSRGSLGRGRSRGRPRGPGRGRAQERE